MRRPREIREFEDGEQLMQQGWSGTCEYLEAFLGSGSKQKRMKQAKTHKNYAMI